MRRRRLGLLLATAAVALTGCGSSSSPATATGPRPLPSGPIHDARVLPLVAMHGVAGPVSTQAMPLVTPAQQAAFVRQFPGALVQRRVRGALRGPLQHRWSNVVGAVVASGCDVPPGVVVTADGRGGVTIVAKEVPSPLPECLIPVTTVALVDLPVD
jgi:hypothetical protein